MDRDNDLILLLTVLLIFWCFCYVAYKYGRVAERTSLALVLKGAMVDAYGDGYKDGEGKGRTKGWADGVRECDNDELYSGRY